MFEVGGVHHVRTRPQVAREVRLDCTRYSLVGGQGERACGNEPVRLLHIELIVDGAVRVRVERVCGQTRQATY